MEVGFTTSILYKAIEVIQPTTYNVLIRFFCQLEYLSFVDHNIVVMINFMLL